MQSSPVFAAVVVSEPSSAQTELSLKSRVTIFGLDTLKCTMIPSSRVVPVDISSSKPLLVKVHCFPIYSGISKEGCKSYPNNFISIKLAHSALSNVFPFWGWPTRKP